MIMLNQQKNKKSNGKGCLFLIIGSIISVVALILFIPLAGKLTSIIVNDTMADTVGYAMLNAAEPCIMVASLFLFAILMLHYFDFDNAIQQSQKNRGVGGGKTYKFFGTKAATWVITAVLLVCVVATAFVYATTYRTVTTEGVSNKICYFITTDEYTWQQVSSYKVDCDDDKGLSVTFTMRDGKQIEILQSAQSAPRAFHETYECKEAFALDLIEMLEEEYQITRNVAHMEKAVKFYKNNDELWPYVKQILGYDELVPEEGEIAETQGETSVDTVIETGVETVAEGMLDTRADTVAQTN